MELVDTSGEQEAHLNQHAVPLPENVAALYRNLANAFEMMRGGTDEPTQQNHDGPTQQNHDELLASLVEELMRNADDPPTEVKGVPDSFLDDLDRVPKKSLKPAESCPICGNPFLDGMSFVRHSLTD